MAVYWRGRRIKPTRKAFHELADLGLTLYEVAEVLERGVESPRKRARGILEKDLRRGGKVVKVVVAESRDLDLDEDIWVLIHVGMIKYEKRRIA